MIQKITDRGYDTTISEGLGRLRVYLFDGDTPALIDTTYEQYCDRLIRIIEEIRVSSEILMIAHEDPSHIDSYDRIFEELTSKPGFLKRYRLTSTTNPIVRLANTLQLVDSKELQH